MSKNKSHEGVSEFSYKLTIVQVVVGTAGEKVRISKQVSGFIILFAKS